MRNLLRPDTPTLVALADVADAPNASTQTYFGSSGRRAQANEGWQGTF
jgi:hypothetical protein